MIFLVLSTISHLKLCPGHFGWYIRLCTPRNSHFSSPTADTYIWLCAAAPNSTLAKAAAGGRALTPTSSFPEWEWRSAPLCGPSHSLQEREVGVTALFLQGGLKLPSHRAQTEQVLRVPGPTPTGSLGSRGCWVKGTLGSGMDSTLMGRAQNTTCVFWVEDGGSAPTQSCQHHPTGRREHKPAWVGWGLSWAREGCKATLDVFFLSLW